MAWVKPFAAFKRNVSVAYAWEPVIVKPCRKPVVSDAMVFRDWIAEPITLRRGLAGAKPAAVCRWGFEVLGLTPDDELVDLFPGTGGVTRAWERWRSERPLPLADREWVTVTLTDEDGTDYEQGWTHRPITTTTGQARPCAHIHGNEISECSWCGSLPPITTSVPIDKRPPALSPEVRRGRG
jgi:hypothetical protein